MGAGGFNVSNPFAGQALYGGVTFGDDGCRCLFDQPDDPDTGVSRSQDGRHVTEQPSFKALLGEWFYHIGAAPEAVSLQRVAGFDQGRLEDAIMMHDRADQTGRITQRLGAEIKRRGGGGESVLVEIFLSQARSKPQ